MPNTAQLTTFRGVAFRKARIFSATVALTGFRAARVPTHACGVMMRFASDSDA